MKKPGENFEGWIHNEKQYVPVHTDRNLKALLQGAYSAGYTAGARAMLPLLKRVEPYMDHPNQPGRLDVGQELRDAIRALEAE